MYPCDRISPGVENVLWALDPKGAPSGSREFPIELNSEIPRFRGQASMWLKEVVDVCLDKEISGICIEDNIGIIAQVKWNGTFIDYACIHVIATPDNSITLLDIYENQEISADYLRLDIDSTKLGKPFTHPYPHLHFATANPRLDFAIGDAGNVIVDFLDFIYRHYKHEMWWDWVECTCVQRSLQSGEVEIPLERIKAAYCDNQVSILNDELLPYLERIKVLIGGVKRDMYSLRLSENYHRLLRYP